MSVTYEVSDETVLNILGLQVLVEPDCIERGHLLVLRDKGVRVCANQHKPSADGRSASSQAGAGLLPLGASPFFVNLLIEPLWYNGSWLAFDSIRCPIAFEIICSFVPHRG